MADPLPSQDWMRLLSPGMSSMLTRLELAARSKKQGPLTGRHSSPDKGFSVVFAEHRQYMPGDDLKDLDWRVFAKAGKYYIRQYTGETNLRATLVVDCSGSMMYRGTLAAELDGVKLSKFEYARCLAAGLAWLMIRQQDAVGLVTFDNRIRSFLRAAGRPGQVRLLLEALNQARPGQDTRFGAVLHGIAGRIPGRGLVIIISDCFGDPDEIIRAFHHFKYRSHEVVLIHLMAEEELTFPFTGSQEFQDLEQEGHRLRVDPRSVRSAYLERIRAHMARLEAACGQINADYVPVSTRQPCPDALARFLSRRRR